uniref:EGF-like domain-containing protein n=1 Tax=Heterorhabditis bacteriophora TaxID=37862 RepID=A0A1I7XRX2_HETBA
MILRLLLIFPIILSQYVGPTTNGYRNYNQNENQYDLNQNSVGFNGMNGYDFRRGVVKQILTPYNITSNNNTLANSGVTIQFQLRGYSNPSSSLPNGWTCICPAGATCSYLKSLPACYIGFTFIISSPDLILSYSIACSGSLIGPSCDLTCNQSHINQNVAACRSNITGFFMVCNYQSGGQVNNCKNCPWGIKESTYCQDEDGLVLDPQQAGVVDTSYKTATIILAIISIILFLLTVIALTAVFLLRRAQQKDKEMTIFARSEGAAAYPLLHASYRSDSGPPTPFPRSQPPSLDAKPIKSSLRKPMAPPTHLNSTRDTSLSSDVPVRPSRSEIV